MGRLGQDLMSFIRRSDGTTVYSGPHVTVRDWRGGAAQNSVSAEDKAWERQVLAACSELGESFSHRWHEDPGMYEDDPMDSGNVELGLVARLFGMYRRPERDDFMPERGCFRRQ